MLSHILYMEALYEKVYHEEADWKKLQTTRKVPHMYYRHLVRYFTYKEFSTSLHQIAQIEGKLLNRKPVSHDSIINSIDAVNDILIGSSYYNDVLKAKEEIDFLLYQDKQIALEKDFQMLPPAKQTEVFIDLLKQGAIRYTDARQSIDHIQNQKLLIPNYIVEQDLSTITYTEDQEKALEEIEAWMDEPAKMGEEDPDVLYKTLSGYAGTGKTTLLNKVVEMAKDRWGRVIVTATTNKAVKVLVDRVEAENYATIHSLLHIKPHQVGTKEIFKPDYDQSGDSLENFNFVIIDEASMISSVDELDPETNEIKNPSLLTLIKEANRGYTKILFCGDSAQLQPVGEDTISAIFDYNPVTLTQVVRHGDVIANKAKLVRDNSEQVNALALLEEPEIQQIKAKQIWEQFENFRQNPDRIRMLCWTNKQVDYWNHQLRLADYGGPTDHPFMPGDIIIANSPCVEGREIVMMNSEEGVVTHTVEHESYYRLTVDTFSGSTIKVRVVKEDFKSTLSDMLQTLASTTQWKKYWELKKYYHDIKHCYALTTHKSQGSTFSNVILDWQNMQRNYDVKNRNQLIYVAMTRAAERVFVHF